MIDQFDSFVEGKVFDRTYVMENAGTMRPATFWVRKGNNVKDIHEFAHYIAIPLLSMTDGASPVERINSYLKHVEGDLRHNLTHENHLKRAKRVVNSRALKDAKAMLKRRDYPCVTSDALFDEELDANAGDEDDADDADADDDEDDDSSWTSEVSTSDDEGEPARGNATDDDNEEEEEVEDYLDDGDDEPIMLSDAEDADDD